MIEASIDTIIKMCDALAARKGMSDDTSLPYIPLQRIVDSIVEVGSSDAGENKPRREAI